MQASPIVLAEDVVLAPLLAEIATRLADEGVPVRAIARGLQVHPDPVRDAINTSILEGRICEVPREDWPPGLRRVVRVPDNRRKLSDQETCSLLRQVFRFTKTEAILFLPLLTKPGEHTKEALHHMVYSAVPNGGPEIKIVDVMICKMRRKLSAAGIGDADYVRDHVLMTIWGAGYRLTPEGNKAIEAMLLAELDPPLQEAA